MKAAARAKRGRGAADRLRVGLGLLAVAGLVLLISALLAPGPGVAVGAAAQQSPLATPTPAPEGGGRRAPSDESEPPLPAPGDGITETEQSLSDDYPQPSVALSGGDSTFYLSDTHWVTVELTNDGSERTMSWGIQVRVSDGLTLVDDTAFERTETLCDETAARWRRDVDLDPGESASIRVGIKAEAVSARETIWYTAWMVDPDKEPEEVQYAHAYSGDPCDRGYAEHQVEVLESLATKPLRARAIQTAAHQFIGDFALPTGLSQAEGEAIVLSVAAQESGGHAFNNEMVTDDWGRGIMQITWPNIYVGGGSGGCSTDDCWACQERTSREACYRYYANTPQGVARNVRDGLYVLQDKRAGSPTNWQPVDLGLGDPVTAAEMGWIYVLKRYGPNYNAVKPFYYVREIGKLLDWELVAHYGDAQPTYRLLGQKLMEAYGHLISGSGPADLRVRDAAGRTTGLVSGGDREEIPNSWYIRSVNRITLLFPVDAYRYQVVGREEGEYSLNAVAEPEPGPVTWSGSSPSAATFAVADVPIEPGAVHEYDVDWAESGEEATRRTDSDGDGVFEQTTLIRVPYASFTVSVSRPHSEEFVTFDASASTDPDDNIASYSWDFGDGGQTSAGPEVAHRFMSPGTYVVRLTVRDAHGAVDTAYHVLTVELKVADTVYLPLIAR